jgi:aryl-alcohol dehydrogenase-like predicted oxidoreductase
VNYRHLGQSGLVVSEIAYGNWITHAAQIDKDAAIACVRAALEEGITTFDTADVYAKTRAEEVLGEALASTGSGQVAGQRRQGLEIFTKVYSDRAREKRSRAVAEAHHGVD